MAGAQTEPRLTALALADPPQVWRDLGFTVLADRLVLDGVTLRLGAPGSGIVGWTLAGLAGGAAPVDVDGLPTEPLPAAADAVAPASAPAHPNGALGLDHVVVVTPDFDRTEAAFGAVGIAYRRVRTAGGAVRQGFRRLGPGILEVVEASGEPDGPARFWGLVVTVADLDAVAARLGPERCGEPRDAVQPGRRIATVRRAAGVSAALAFMTAD